MCVGGGRDRHIHACVCTFVFMYVCGACAEAGDQCSMSHSTALYFNLEMQTLTEPEAIG